jgi:hypothetical protein
MFHKEKYHWDARDYDLNHRVREEVERVRPGEDRKVISFKSENWTQLC